MAFRWFDLAIACFCFLLLIVGIANFLHSESIKAENEGLSSEVEGLRAELSDARDTIAAQGRKVNEVELAAGEFREETETDIGGLSSRMGAAEGKLSELEANFSVFEEEYIELQGSYDVKVEEYGELMGQLEDFEGTLEEKMYWYSENADFGGAHKNFLNTIESKCINGDTLNMPCVAIMLDQKGFDYLSEDTDYIKSLEEFEDADGGDCEDWSMFVKAVINEMEEQEGVGELELVHFGKTGRTDIYEDGDVLYYYPYGSVTVGIEELNIACFPVTVGMGHCALVSEGVLFEPQDGSYLSGVNWNGEDLHINTGGQVEILIDDSDIHIRDGEGWISYAYFIGRIREVLEEVESEASGQG
jgi:hypothetical protein